MELGVRIKCDEHFQWLRIEGKEFGPSGGAEGEFAVLASYLGRAHLAELPKGTSIQLCDRIIGSNDLIHRYPYCTFEHTADARLVAHSEAAFFSPNEDVTPSALRRFLSDSVMAAKRSLEPLVADGTLIRMEESIYEEIAYLQYSVSLSDQPILEAEAFMAALEVRVREGLDRPLLFVCHASEDKAFVDRLVRELDCRALHAWYDKREILVGDSIVDNINKALKEARYVLAILSPYSVVKPWVTRELNSTLKRQLDREQITILPALVADCDVPPLIADLKYADFRTSFEQGFEELLGSVRRSTTGPTQEPVGSRRREA
jgi:hypothetical protein